MPNVMVCYGSTCPQPCCGYSAVQCAWRGCLLQLPPRAAAVAESNTACERGADDGCTMTAPRCVSFDHDWSTVSTRIGPLLCFCSQHMSRLKIFFLWACSVFDIVTPDQVSETSSRFQRGGSVMASNSSSAAARKSQVAVAIALTVCE